MDRPRTTDLPASAETLARILRDCQAATGVAAVLYRPDGQVLADLRDGAKAREAGGEVRPTAEDGFAPLVREAADRNEDRIEKTDGRLRAAWPIRQRGQTVLVAAAALPAEGEQAERLGRRLLAAAAEGLRTGLALATARAEGEALAEALSQTFEEVSLLHSLGEVVRVNRPVTEFLNHACDQLCEVTGAEAAAAYMPAVDGDEQETVVAGSLPFDAAALPRLIDHVLGSVGPEQSVVINNHCQDDPELARLSIALERLVLVPLPLRDGVRGALLAVNCHEGEFGSPHAKLVRSITSSGAVFIENHRLYRELRRLMLDLVRALVSSVDAKDPYTCGHSERVAITCREIARQMNLSDQDVERTYLAGLLHDIGKIGTPGSILRKEGRLSAEERRIVQQHPVISDRILEGIRRLEAIREAVRHHHERPDGSGYPDGLKGEEVPLLARIVGLADAFDAMSSNRPYRPMMPLEQVKREIERHTGTQFDVRVVDALLSLNLNRLMQQFVDRPTTVSFQLAEAGGLV